MAKSFEPDDKSVVVVIGSGAGGGTVANELAQKGIDVVCLEAGPRLTLADVVNDTVAMHLKMSWLDKRIGKNVWLCKTVGGTTMRWSGVTPRIQPHEFKARSTYDGLEDTSLIDWPLSYEDIEPYYLKAEDKMGVSGTHDIPPSAETNNFKVLRAGGKRIGYKEITSTRTAINPEPRGGRPGCQQIGFCNAGCAIGAKWSTLYTEIPAAEQTGHFELRPESMAVRINHDANGRVNGVVYADKDGKLHEQKARAVCVAGNVVETSRILLNSDSSMYPTGLGNSSDQVGRHYTRHMFALAYAVMPKPVNYHRGTRQSGIILDEQYHTPERGFDGGYIIQTLSIAPLDVSVFVNDWGRDATVFTDNYTHLAGVFVTGEDPPEANNRITVHATERDEHGLPVPVLEYQDHANTIAMRDHAVAQSKKLYESLGSTHFWGGEGPPIGAHNMGVARMSERPGDGVTNRWGQCHDVDNLFVSDGSTFSSSAAANPTLTIVALAIRQADYIADQMVKKAL